MSTQGSGATSKESGKASKEEKIFQYAFETRQFEIGLFWQRSLFFWGFIAVAFVAYGAVANLVNADDSVLLAIACFGIVCSVAWTLANRGSKYWQGAWEEKLETYEKEVLGTALFSEIYEPRGKFWWGEWRYSVTRLTIALSDFTVFLWAFLVMKSLPVIEWPVAVSDSVLLLLTTIVYLIAMLVYGRSPNK